MDHPLPRNGRTTLHKVCTSSYMMSRLKEQTKEIRTYNSKVTRLAIFVFLALLPEAGPLATGALETAYVWQSLDHETNGVLARRAECRLVVRVGAGLGNDLSTVIPSVVASSDSGARALGEHVNCRVVRERRGRAGEREEERSFYR